MELSTASGEWGMTFHQDPLISPQQVGLFPVVMPGPHKRAALDYRYDGFIGFWFEGATLFSDNANFSGNNRYTLATLGGDFTIPLFTGILIMSESMHIRSSQNNSDTDDQTYSFFMASMPLGFYISLWPSLIWTGQVRECSTFSGGALRLIISV